MKDKKGFTLVELLAVIVILAILVTIAVPSTIAISKKIKSNMYDAKIDLILNAAVLYGQDYSTKVNSSESCSGPIITLQELVDKGYVKKDDKSGNVISPIDNSRMNNLRICIYSKNNRVYAKLK